MARFVALLFLLLVGCSEEAVEYQPTYQVRISPELGEVQALATLDAVERINTRLGVVVFRAVVGEAMPLTDWVINVHPGDPASRSIGFSSFRNLQATIWLRDDASDWTTPAHELLHCLTIDHSDDVRNVMFEDYTPLSIDISDEQVEQALGWVYL